MSAARAERWILAALIAVLLGLIALDMNSRVAAQLRTDEPWMARLALSPGASAGSPLYLVRYDWNRRMLHLIRLPPPPRRVRRIRHATNEESAEMTVAQSTMTLTFEEAPLLRWTSAPMAASSVDGLKSWIAGRPQGLRFWTLAARLAPRLRRDTGGRIGLYDTYVLARELYRLPARRIRRHQPAGEADLASLLARLEDRAVRPPSGPLPVAVLNASGEAGVALQVTKVLRWRGLDVVDFGTATTASPTTRLIDHGATDGEIAFVLRLLGCGELDVDDGPDAGRRERLTIVLGSDFKHCSLGSEAGRGS